MGGGGETPCAHTDVSERDFKQRKQEQDKNCLVSPAQTNAADQGSDFL